MNLPQGIFRGFVFFFTSKFNESWWILSYEVIQTYHEEAMKWISLEWNGKKHGSYVPGTHDPERRGLCSIWTLTLRCVNTTHTIFKIMILCTDYLWGFSRMSLKAFSPTLFFREKTYFPLRLYSNVCFKSSPSPHSLQISGLLQRSAWRHCLRHHRDTQSAALLPGTHHPGRSGPVSPFQ